MIAKAFVTVMVVSIVAYCQAADKTPKTQRIETGKVTSVTDGDTVRVLVGKEELRVRLEGIDAPESKQAFGTRAKQHLSELVFSKTVELHITGTDRYGRTLGKLFIGGEDINRQMLRDGFAWHFIRYNLESHYASAETAARSEKTGLWADPAPVPPWEFRKKK